MTITTDIEYFVTWQCGRNEKTRTTNFPLIVFTLGYIFEDMLRKRTEQDGDEDWMRKLELAQLRQNKGELHVKPLFNYSASTTCISSPVGYSQNDMVL